MTGATGLDRENGSSLVSTAVLVPALLLLFAFATFAGRLTIAQHDVVTASRDAARAATTRQTRSAGEAEARAAAAASLADAGTMCTSVTVDFAGTWQPGDPIAVRVSCSLRVADLALAGTWAPGAKTVSATSTALVDRFRASPP